MSFMMRELGTRESRDNDLLSLVTFEAHYLRRLIELGEADARARADEIGRFVGLRGAAGNTARVETIGPSR